MSQIRIPISSLSGAIPASDGSGYRFVVQFLDSNGALINDARLTQNQVFLRANATAPFDLLVNVSDGVYTLNNTTIRVHSDSTGSGKYQDKVANIVVNCGYSMSIYNISRTVELNNPPQPAPDCFFSINILEPSNFRNAKTFFVKVFQNGNLLNGPNGQEVPMDTSGYTGIIFDPKNTLWQFNGPGLYTIQVSTTYNNTVYQDSAQITLQQSDFDCGTGTRPGDSTITINDYTTNGNQVALNLAGGTSGDLVTINLKQGVAIVGSLSASYTPNMTLTSSAYGYLDVYVGNYEIGSVYLPQKITSSNFSVEKAKAVDEETWFMNLQFSRVGEQFVVTDSATPNFTNIEYWHGKDYLGSTIPANYAVEPNIDHHITKKGWTGGSWSGSNGDGVNRMKSQLTFKIISA